MGRCGRPRDPHPCDALFRPTQPGTSHSNASLLPFPCTGLGSTVLALGNHPICLSSIQHASASPDGHLLHVILTAPRLSSSLDKSGIGSYLEAATKHHICAFSSSTRWTLSLHYFIFKQVHRLSNAEIWHGKYISRPSASHGFVSKCGECDTGPCTRGAPGWAIINVHLPMRDSSLM